MLKAFTSLFGRSNQVLGIELTPERVNLVQIHKQRQGLKIKSLTTVPVPDGILSDGQIIDTPAMSEIIQQAVAESKTKASHVATCIPGRNAIVRLISVPSDLDNEELRDLILNHEASLYLPYPQEQADIDYQTLEHFIDEDGIDKVRVLLVATRKDITQTYLDAFEQAGLTVDTLEINSFALIRTIREQLQLLDPTEAAVLVDIEFDSTEIAIVINGVPQFSRTIPIGTYQMQAALSKDMNLPISRDTDMLESVIIPENSRGIGDDIDIDSMLNVLRELSDELSRTINFYVNQSVNLEVVQLFLAGPGAGIQQLGEFLTKKLGLPTIPIDPFTCLSLSADIEEYPLMKRPGLGIVLGLGIRGVE
ncbi:type IV pilus assembly protein PilM [Dolichospermum circinale CS-545/17]|uniref:Type IV pilus assembly protein PilM n=1 Tax=Dolichospermum circinale CS-537/01 TaxID=3021739 RepID=A0ABT5A6A6_9CYAN|nr:type IV pilus assembly protein PilM [Dolichospermum circinale]MDB9458076.1 type IV pilus assembly protein PilM [Dolichospermum circinale CS-545/17]MDB9487476.1 type IV pilus assembly protein PilM [Dolichospermum circinale CS-537/01]